MEHSIALKPCPLIFSFFFCREIQVERETVSLNFFSSLFCFYFRKKKLCIETVWYKLWEKHERIQVDHCHRIIAVITFFQESQSLMVVLTTFSLFCSTKTQQCYICLAAHEKCKARISCKNIFGYFIHLNYL